MPNGLAKVMLMGSIGLFLGAAIAGYIFRHVTPPLCRPARGGAWTRCAPPSFRALGDGRRGDAFAFSGSCSSGSRRSDAIVRGPLQLNSKNLVGLDREWPVWTNKRRFPDRRPRTVGIQPKIAARNPNVPGARNLPRRGLGRRSCRPEARAMIKRAVPLLMLALLPRLTARFRASRVCGRWRRLRETRRSKLSVAAAVASRRGNPPPSARHRRMRDFLEPRGNRTPYKDLQSSVFR